MRCDVKLCGAVPWRGAARRHVGWQRVWSRTRLARALVSVLHELDDDERAVMFDVLGEVHHARGGPVELLAELEAAAEDGGLDHGCAALLARGVVAEVVAAGVERLGWSGVGRGWEGWRTCWSGSSRGCAVVGWVGSNDSRFASVLVLDVEHGLPEPPRNRAHARGAGGRARGGVPRVMLGVALDELQQAGRERRLGVRWWR